MKTFLTSLFLLLVAFVATVKSAVVVSDITTNEFESLISTNQAAASVYYRGGSTGIGSGSEEIRLARNIAIPQINGGNNTLIGQISWGNPAQIGFEINSLGYLSAFGQSTFLSSQDFAVTKPYNQFLILVEDSSFFGASNLDSIMIYGIQVRELSADGMGANAQSDGISITGFDPNVPLTITATWDFGLAPNFDDQSVWIVALNNPSVPEPSSTMMIISSIALLCFRRR